MEFGLLGPLMVRRGESTVPIPAGHQRLLLAALLLKANQVMSADELAELLWAADLPATARKTLHNYVKRLRHALGDTDHSRIATQPEGYLISVGSGELDVTQFAALHGQARVSARRGAWPLASAQLRSALALWRGEALTDVPCDPLLTQERLLLGEMRVQALEDRIDADLHVGLHDEVIVELRKLASAEPLRERLHALLMLALYRAGRRADSLAVYRDARRVLVSELAIEPGVELRQLHERIQRADPALALQPVTGAHLAGGHAAPVIPRQLPAAPAHFVGRVGELEALSALLGKAARTGSTMMIWAVGGTAGVGKTALAVHWAHQVKDGFPDGQLYVNLHGFGPSDPVLPAAALRRFLEGLQVPAAQIPGDFEGQQGLYRSLLADRSLLVVLDNARDADQVRPLLPGTPHSLVVVTSRSELTGLAAAEGARQLTLDVLTNAEAQELLARRVGAARLAAEPDAAQELTGLCAGLPLALAVAAARAAARPGFPLAVLAAELRNPRGQLDALNAGDTATDIRAVFSWSYRSLSAPASRLFRLLGLHPGPDISAPAAASLAGISSAQAHASLGELGRASLIAEPVPGRFAFHDLLRAYAAEQASSIDSGPDRHAAIHRVLDHYLHTAHAAAALLYPARGILPPAPLCPGAAPQHFAGYGDAWAWFDAEYPVLIAMITLAAHVGFDSHAWQLPWTLAEFLDRRSHWHDWAATQQIALAAAVRLADPDAQARAHRDLGYAHARLSCFDDAHTHLSRALDLHRQLGDQVGQARVHYAHAQVFELQDDRQRALSEARQALKLYQTAGHQGGQARALNALGWYSALLGDHVHALAYCEQAIVLLRDLGDLAGEADTWDSLGYAHHHLGHHAEAVACYTRAVDPYQHLGDRDSQATALTHIGDIHLAAGSHGAARETWQQALAILDDLHHPDADRVRAKLQDAATC